MAGQEEEGRGYFIFLFLLCKNLMRTHGDSNCGDMGSEIIRDFGTHK